MKRNTSFAMLTVIVICSLTGCATYWYQEGKSFEKCKQDRLECYEQMRTYSQNPDDLGRYEFKYMSNCMKRKGYRLVTERELYVTVKREDPNLTVPWQIHGVAGFLEENN